ncbi:MAG: heme ABC exporter ATP-binding protein CcmA, partial [Alphaproteobacteria bacterium]
MPPLLATYNLSFHRAGCYFWQDLTLQVNAGDLCVVRGANGSGKTSLLKVLAGVMPPSSGRVEGFTKSIGYVGHSSGLYPTLSVWEYLQAQAVMAEQPASTSAKQMSLWGLENLADIPLAKLSFGQKRRVSLARLGINSASLWLLDEPTAGLDADAISILWSVITAQQTCGRAVIMASHHEVPLPIQQQIALTN